MLKRRLKLLGKILLGFIALGVAFLLVERWRGQIALASYKKALRAKGEKIFPQDFVKTFKAEDNGALAARAALERLTNGAVLPNSRPPAMEVVPSGRAVVGFREAEWIELGAFREGEWLKGPFTNYWLGVAADLQANGALLAEIQKAMEAPILNHQLDFANPSQIKFLHIIKPKQAAHWYGAGAQLKLREGRLSDARNDLVAEVSLLRFLAEDHIAISELVRIAVAALARAHTWEALQVEGWRDEDLAAVQAAWEQQRFSSNMTHALEGELVFMSGSISEMRKSNEQTYTLLFGGLADFLDDAEAGPNAWIERIKNLPGGEAAIDFWRRQIYCRLWRFAWSHQAERRMMQNMTELIRLARIATGNSSYQAIEDDLTSLLFKATDKGPYDRLRFPPPESVVSLSKTIQKATRGEIDRSLALCAIGLKRYSLRHGRLPENLTALVPEFLSAIPVDYMDGQPIKYRLNADGSFTLYSVGEDGKDDGGDVSLPEGSKSRDLWRRRDYVWPAPATPEEVAEYRRQAGKD